MRAWPIHGRDRGWLPDGTMRGRIRARQRHHRAIRAGIEDYFNAPLRLYGVFRTPGIWDHAETYTAIFYGFGALEHFAIVAMLNETGLVGVGTGCGASPEQLGAPYGPPVR